MRTLSRTVLLPLRRKPHPQTSSLNITWQGQIIISCTKISIPPQKTPKLLHKPSTHTGGSKAASNRIENSNLQINCTLIIHPNPLEDRKAESLLGGNSEGFDQLKHLLQDNADLPPHPLHHCHAPVLILLQQAVDQNLHIEVNALQLVELYIRALKCEHLSTQRPRGLEMAFILREYFTFHFTFPVQFCFPFSWQEPLLKLITRTLNSPLMFSPSGLLQRKLVLSHLIQKSLSQSYIWALLESLYKPHLCEGMSSNKYKHTGRGLC